MATDRQTLCLYRIMYQGQKSGSRSLLPAL